MREGASVDDKKRGDGGGWTARHDCEAPMSVAFDGGGDRGHTLGDDDAEHTVVEVGTSSGACKVDDAE